MMTASFGSGAVLVVVTVGFGSSNSTEKSIPEKRLEGFLPVFQDMRVAEVASSPGVIVKIPAAEFLRFQIFSSGACVRS